MTKGLRYLQERLQTAGNCPMLVCDGGPILVVPRGVITYCASTIGKYIAGKGLITGNAQPALSSSDDRRTRNPGTIVTTMS